MNSLKKYLTTLSLCFICLTGNVNAAIIFFDNFDEADITGSHGNFNTLDNWNVTNGTVDAFVNGGFALPCISGGCLDMDGSTSNGGRIESKNIFNFTANTLYRLTIEYRGNARSGTDSLLFGFTGDNSLTINNINSGDGWTTAILDVNNITNWNSKLFIEDPNNDNQGALLSSVKLESIGDSQIPSPKIVWLFALGFIALTIMKKQQKQLLGFQS